MFDKHIVEFNENVLSLRDFVDLIEPILIKRFEEHDEKVKPIILKALLQDLIKRKPEELKDIVDDNITEIQTKLNEKIRSIYNDDLEVEFESVETTNEKSTLKKLKIKTSKPTDIDSYFQNVRKSSNHIELLYKNSLISFLSSVEWFFAQILHYYYDKFPDSAGINEKNLKLSDLKSFQTIKDAEKYLIEVKIEEVLRGNFESWIELLKKDLKLGLGYIDNMKDELVEIYQRRNLLVHNGGIVNSIYITKVKEELIKDLEIGDPINVNKDYLDNSIWKLQLSFILVGAELWKKLDSEDKKRGDILTDIVYENVLKSRWEIADGISYFIINDAKMGTTDKLVSQLNNWLCKKRMNRYDTVKKDIDKADFSDKKEIFQLALAALKEDKESFFRLLPIALDSKQINIKRLEEFPILEEMRATEEYSKFKSESKYFKEPNQPIEPE
jgi:hypothetical protein